MTQMVVKGAALALGLAMAGGAAMPAMAQEATGLSGWDVLRVMNQAGHNAEFADDSTEESPLLYGAMPIGDVDLNYSIRLFDCDLSSNRCQTVMIFTTFDQDGALSPSTLAAVNSYNDSNPLGRAFALEGGVGVDMAFVADMAQPSAYLARRLEQFPDVIMDFTLSF